MCPNDLEDDLRNLKFAHLTRAEMDAYCDNELDSLNRTRADAHLNQCSTCSRTLSLLLDEAATLKQRHTSSEDVPIVEDLIDDQDGEQSLPKVAEIASDVRLRERIEDYLRCTISSLQLYLSSVNDEAVRSWQWDSDDGLFTANGVAVGENITIFLTSIDAEFVGAALKIRMGGADRAAEFQMFGESIVADLSIPSRSIRDNLEEISIQVVKYSKNQ